MRRVRALMRKELLELKDDPRLFGIVLVAPIIQLLLLGYAATNDVQNVPMVLVDADRSALSRELVARFEGSPYFSVVGAEPTVADVGPWLERNRAWLALVIPADYSETITKGGQATVQVIADGSDASSINVALGYAGALVSGYAQELTSKRRAAVVPVRALEARMRVWYNSQLESRDFMVPGVVALLLLVVTTNLSSMAVVRERELGTLEQLNVTPVARWELILGKLLPYGLIGVVDVILVTAFAVLWFEIPLRGSVVLLFVMSLVYLLTTLGLGLFVSTISSTQQQAMMTATFFFLIPMLYLSGFIFPIENMPAPMQLLTYLVPLRYFIVIVRGIFLKGVGLEVLWPQALALLAWGVAILVLATARSRKTLG